MSSGVVCEMSCIFLISDECPFKSIVLRYAGDVPGMSCVIRGHLAVKILGRNSCVVYKIRKWLRNRVEILSAGVQCWSQRCSEGTV